MLQTVLKVKFLKPAIDGCKSQIEIKDFKTKEPIQMH